MGLKIMPKTFGNIIVRNESESGIYIFVNILNVHESQVFPIKKAKKGHKMAYFWSIRMCPAKKSNRKLVLSAWS